MSKRRRLSRSTAARKERAGKTPTRIREDGRKVADIPATRTHREKVTEFVKAYKATGSITEACKTSGLSNGHAKDLIQCHPELREDVSSLLARCGVTPELIVTQLRRLATSDLRKLSDENGNAKPINELDDDTAHAAQSVRFVSRTYTDRKGEETTETTSDVRLADREGPTKELARMHGIVSDRLEIANAPGQKFNINNDGPTETRDQIIASLLSLVAPKKDPPKPEKEKRK